MITGCSVESDISRNADVKICFGTSDIWTKSEIPDEDRISDISLLIFDAYGSIEQDIYLASRQQSCSVSLLKGAEYSIYACVNFGYEVKADREEDMAQIEFYLAYPDEYREGIPMCASMHGFVVKDDCTIMLELERLMSEIRVRMDRSRLSEGVRMDVKGIRIGNCPKKVKPFCESRTENEDDCFRVGFIYDDVGCSALNRQDINGVSNYISLYMLENRQGEFPVENIRHDSQKVFKENDPRRETCSYIEMELEYTYKDLVSIEKPLIYRFYLGEDLNSLDVVRNCRYNITVSPEDDGLSEDGWRVDKTGISYIGEPGLIQYPGDYIRGDIGDVIHIGCHLTPYDTPFNIGIEYLEEDRARGIYEYRIDEDGHGVMLTLTGAGTGLIYMEAGDPINDAALFLIEVNL